MARLYCDKCNYTGLLPFMKNGRVIPHTFIYCECYEEPQEHYCLVQPEDFDFPMSYDCYRGLCQHHGWPDPGSCELSEEKTQPEERPLVRGLHWQQQVEAERINVRKKLVEALLEIDRLKAKVDRDTNTYNYISIKEEGDLPGKGEADDR